MKIEAGKYYQTEGEQKVLILATHDPFTKDAEYPIVGWVDGCRGVKEWNTEGHRSPYGGECFSDLVGEWPEYREPTQEDTGKAVEVRDSCDGWIQGILVAVADPGITEFRFLSVGSIGGLPTGWRQARIKNE